jgi:hypothetical protein
MFTLFLIGPGGRIYEAMVVGVQHSANGPVTRFHHYRKDERTFDMFVSLSTAPRFKGSMAKLRFLKDKSVIGHIYTGVNPDESTGVGFSNGGGLNPNESSEQCLVRETMEETGMSVSGLDSHGETRTSWRDRNTGKLITRTVHHFVVHVKTGTSCSVCSKLPDYEPSPYPKPVVDADNMHRTSSLAILDRKCCKECIGNHFADKYPELDEKRQGLCVMPLDFYLDYIASLAETIPFGSRRGGRFPVLRLELQTKSDEAKAFLSSFTYIPMLDSKFMPYA